MLQKLSEIFSVEYPKTMIFSEQETDPAGFPFVSSSGENNGIVGRIKENKERKLYKAGAITVPLKGSVLDAFYQPEDFYIAHQIAVLYPKRVMSEKELLFYTFIIRGNKFRFSYGRQADKTLKNIMIPATVPKKFLDLEIAEPSARSVSDKTVALSERKWKWFRYDELFDIKKGKRLTKDDMMPGEMPFIGSTESDNGVTETITVPAGMEKHIHQGNVLTVTYNGSVAEAFYQPVDFFASDDVNVLYPKFQLNPYFALFLVSIIKKEKYRYSYGRKWHLDRMRESKMKLPVDAKGNPDWQFMEDYIKSLPYSSEV
jgi:hypothetical protein